MFLLTLSLFYMTPLLPLGLFVHMQRSSLLTKAPHELLMNQEVGFAHMRIADGVGTLLQLSGLLAKLCKIREKCKA